MLEKLDRHDIVEAAINSSSFDIANIMEVAFVIDAHKDHRPFKPSMENITRSINIVKKNKSTSSVNAASFESQAEQNLYDVVVSLQDEWMQLSAENKFRTLVHDLCPAIENFFENVMVMAEDEAVRENRLALLSEVVTLTSSMADFSLINTK